MSHTLMLHVRVDGQLKTEAAESLAKFGLTVSDAVRILLTRVTKEVLAVLIARVRWSCALELRRCLHRGCADGDHPSGAASGSVLALGRRLNASRLNRGVSCP